MAVFKVYIFLLAIGITMVLGYPSGLEDDEEAEVPEEDGTEDIEAPFRARHILLTTAEAPKESAAWPLCFRRTAAFGKIFPKSRRR